MPLSLWYNPRCNTCRRVKAALEAAGQEVEVVEYLKGRERAEWQALADAVPEPTRLLREREPLYRDLKLDEKIAAGKVGKSQVVDLLAKHPRLLERPVVVAGGRAFIVRPAERVKDVLREIS